ncbi:TolC family protein [Geobacter chapellei]|uniref:TolC family protein n=2 Tax=Pelotalea chapellei TaxID=44671 RepID=A0ABS5U7Q5_9BACT|nr:TolC family protein [Pelotalea chapellei]MBT1071696.1 TolC family protein [Pelotalea chapellei]
MTGGRAEADPLKLSLQEAIRMAAENNLDVRVELYNPAQYEADVRRNRSIYDPTLNLQTKYTNTTSPITSGLVGSSLNNRSFFVDTSISQLLWTGGVVSLAFDNSYVESGASVIGRNYWESGLGLTFTQPLLKNFGRESTEININISRLSKYASLDQFNNKLINTIAQVRNEYFRLYSLQQQLEVRRVSLDLARRILNDTKSRVTAGVLPAMEILNAEFGVTSRERDVIEAEKSVNDQIDILHLLLQIEGGSDIVVVDLPQRAPLQINEAEAIARSLNRPDIKTQKRLLDINELQTRFFSSNIKPDLSLVASGSLVGNDRKYSRDLEKLGSFDYPAWSIGLNFSYPFGNDAAKNDYRKSRLKTEQTALQMRNLEEIAVKDVRVAIRAIATGYKQIDVTDRGRAYAEERLKAFIRKNEVGLATTKDVLEVENDLAVAKNNQIAALVTYANAITQYWLVTGELLDREGVRVVENDADKLYSRIR